MNAEVAWTILLPLLGAVLCCSSRGPGSARAIASIATLGTASAAMIVGSAVATRGPLRHSVGGWGASLGIELRADGIAAVMLVTIGVVGALISAHAIGGRATDSRLVGSFFALWFFAWAALNALVLSADVFNLYVTLELVTLAAVALIAFGGDREAVRAALRYLLVALPGSLVYLLGIALLYGIHSTLDAGALRARIAPGVTTWTALSLVTLGLCLKAALFPLHAWLPPAYVSSEPPVAALLSSLIGKSSFFVLLRLWVDVFPPEFELHAGGLLGALGAGGVLWGSLMALRQRRLKVLIAYSSVAQIGYLFLFFPLSTPGALGGGLYLAISHAASKASMFLAAGAIERAIGHDDLDGLRGLAHHLPLTFVTLALAGVNLMGMPPSGGFVAKWLLVRAAIERDQWWIAVVILVGGLLAAGYVFRLLRGAFLPLSPGARPHPVARGAQLAALALALIAIGLGVLPKVPLELLALGRSS